MTRKVVRAAGCVVWRDAADGIEVLVVRRPPPHDDWSFPKGKLEPGERHRDAAVREVLEETGARGELGPKLADVRYVTAADEDKRVRWWAMRWTGDEGFEPGEEIAERRWVRAADAPALLTWDTDGVVLERLLGHDSFTSRPSTAHR